MYQVGNFVEMKKPHACTIKSTGKKANRWEIIRVGADIKIKCSNCDHVVMMGRYDFDRKMNKIIDWYSMKIKEQTRKLAEDCTWVRQGDVDVVWIWFSKSMRTLS